MEQYLACVKHLQRLLPALIIQPDEVAATWGGSLSPRKTVLCLRELHERMQKLGLEDLQHLPCRADVAVALYSIACKMDLASCIGLRGDEAWRIVLQNQSHVWALYVHSARDAGPPEHLAGLQVEMRGDWLLQIEGALLETLGRGLWDVQRPEAVGGVLRCVWEHMDISACANDCGMVAPDTINMYFASSTGAVLNAAYKFLFEHIGAQQQMLLLTHTCLKTLELFEENNYD